MTIKTLTIIIPVFNEENTIIQVLTKIEGLSLINNISKQVIIVNDGSTDNTEKLINQFIDSTNEDFLNIRLDKNLGKGGAIREAIKMARGEFTIIQDADLEYNPDEINLLLKPVIEGHADIVYGSRFLGGSAHRILFFWHSIGNKFLTFLSNMFTNLNLTDMETCYKLVRTSILKEIKLNENRFGFEPEITARISRIKNVRIYEVGISYFGRTFDEGKKINWKDGMKAIYCIIRYNIFK
jgi:glycosyltransferase involved in cell wall biosynthesis